MKLGIMQPYFFPYLGYFELIARTDHWVVFDVVQYKSRSWMNRNRILHPSKGWQYINVPVAKASRDTLIQDIHVKDMEGSLTRILGQMDHYKKKAPYFSQITELVEKAFLNSRSNRLVDLNISTLEKSCDYLGIPFRWQICSEMGLNLEDIEHPGHWALRIASQLGAQTYINPPGGQEIFKEEEWQDAGINLQFTNLPDLRYDCGPYDFVEQLSIIDVLMWNDPEKVATVLKR